MDRPEAASIRYGSECTLTSGAARRRTRGDERPQVVHALADTDELAAAPRAAWRWPRRRRPWRCRRAWSARARSGRRRRRRPCTCASAFCPVLASSTRSTAWRRAGARLAEDALDLASSSIRWPCVGRRPAVSASTTSIAARPGGVDRVEHRPPPASPPPGGSPRRCCARPRPRAARAPPRGTCRRRRAAPNGSCCCSHLASLPIDVVLPAPFTPASMITNGRSAPITSGFSSGAEQRDQRLAQHARGVGIRPRAPVARLQVVERDARVASTPTSAVSSAVSSSSSASSSSLRR